MTRPASHLVGLIGAGIGTSLSPALHECEAHALGLRYVYRLIDLDTVGGGGDRRGVAAVPAALRTALAFGFDGLNITHPGKQVVLGCLDELAPEARALGAVNTVVVRDGRTVGHNTDWSGFARSFRRGLPGAAIGHVVVLGAGGAGSAATYALCRLGAGRITVLDADAPRASALATSLNRAFGSRVVEAADLSRLGRVVAGADGIVHATPTGMAAHPGTAVPPALLTPPTWVTDIVYRPLETELLRVARHAGCPTLDGGAMAVYQAADAFRLFTGVEPDPDRMLATFTRLIEEETADGVRPG